MELTFKSIIVNKDNYEEKLHNLIQNTEMSSHFLKEDENNNSKFKNSLDMAKKQFGDDIKSLIIKILSDLEAEWDFLDKEVRIAVKEQDNAQYLVEFGASFNLRYLVKYNLEKSLYNSKDHLNVKIKKDNEIYLLTNQQFLQFDCYLVAVNEKIANKLDLDEIIKDSLGLKMKIEHIKEDMEDKEYELNDLLILCIDNEEDYNTDYYDNLNIHSFEINKCYIESDDLIIELN